MTRHSVLPTVLFLSCCLFAADRAIAQRSRPFSYQSASRVGLSQVWSRAITVGRGGKVAALTLRPSTTETYKASEVIDKRGRRVFFSDRDLNVGVSRAGYDQTTRLTALKKAELEARGLEPKVELKNVADVTMYVRSSLGTVVALDAETGRELWTTQAGKAGYPNYAVSASQDFLVTLSGSTIYVLDSASGQILDTIRTRKAPGAAPTLDGDYIYVPTTQGLIEVYSLDETGRVDFTMGSSGRIEDTITVSPNSVSWTTDQGFIYVASVGLPGINYRFQALDTIASSPVYMDGMLFATSMDGFTYAIDEQNGSQKWSFSVGGTTQGGPIAIDGHVYVATNNGQMTCVDVATGQAKWVAPGASQFISLSDSRIYCLTTQNALAALDRTTGEEISSTQLGSETTALVNLTTDRVYLVSGKGMLLGLREAGRRWPTVRMPPVKEVAGEGASTRGEATGTPDAPTAEESESGEDPFIGFDATATEPMEPDMGDDLPPADEEDPFFEGDDDDDDSSDDSVDPGDDPFAEFE